MAATNEKNDTSTTLFGDLLKRRVPQIFGIYLGASWGILQFVDWLVNRYVWSPYLTDFSLVTHRSLIFAMMFELSTIFQFHYSVDGFRYIHQL